MTLPASLASAIASAPSAAKAPLVCAVDWSLVCNLIAALAAIAAAVIAGVALGVWKKQIAAQSRKEIRDQLLDAIAEWEWTFSDVLVALEAMPSERTAIANKIDSALRSMHRIQGRLFAYLPDDERRSYLLKRGREMMDEQVRIQKAVKSGEPIGYHNVDMSGPSLNLIQASAYLTEGIDAAGK